MRQSKILNPKSKNTQKAKQYVNKTISLITINVHQLNSVKRQKLSVLTIINIDYLNSSVKRQRLSG